MRSFLTLYIIFLNTYLAPGQNSDSVSVKKSTTIDSLFNTQTMDFDSNQKSAFVYQKEEQKRFVVKDNIIYVTYNIIMSPLESEIFDLEARECKALLKRDNTTLTSLWARDFTLDEKTNEVVTGTNSLPYYVSFHRMVEKFSAFDNVVFTSGWETFKQLKPDGKIGEPVERNYFHTWTRKFGVWKLTTYTHQNNSRVILPFPEDPIIPKN